jgi:hypothetical protein
MLKDSVTEYENQYYSTVFTDISDKVVSELEAIPYFFHPWTSHDMQMSQYNIRPGNRGYVFVK